MAHVNTERLGGRPVKRGRSELPTVACVVTTDRDTADAVVTELPEDGERLTMSRVERSADLPSATAGTVAELARVTGLDGLRGIAALYVVAFHCWLLTFPGFPGNSGPRWLGWLMYGRLAVVFFLALSGFSLALSTAGRGWQLGGMARYARRRAWRILPPYWAALVISLLVGWAVVPASHFGAPTGETVVVYGLLAQDIRFVPTPNGAFWSIAVEAELYVVFPVLLVLRRRLGVVFLLSLVTIPVVAYGYGSPGHVPVEGSIWLTPDLAPVFALGVAGAGIVIAGERIRRLPWHWFAACAAAPVGLLMLAMGSRWTVGHYYWIDLLVAPAMVMLLVAVACGRPRPVTRWLSVRPMRSLGRFSYSLYLIHLLVVMTIARRVAEPLVGRGVTAFWITISLALPISLLAARLFATVCEIPFQQYRSWSAFWPAIRTWVSRERQS